MTTDVARFLSASRPVCVDLITPLARTWYANLASAKDVEPIGTFRLRVERRDGEAYVIDVAPRELGDLIYGLDFDPERVGIDALDTRDLDETRALIAAAFVEEPVAA